MGIFEEVRGVIRYKPISWWCHQGWEQGDIWHMKPWPDNYHEGRDQTGETSKILKGGHFISHIVMKHDLPINFSLNYRNLKSFASHFWYYNKQSKGPDSRAENEQNETNWKNDSITILALELSLNNYPQIGKWESGLSQSTNESRTPLSVNIHISKLIWAA